MRIHFITIGNTTHYTVSSNIIFVFLNLSQVSKTVLRKFKCRFDSQSTAIVICVDHVSLACLIPRNLIAGQSRYKTETVLHSGPHSSAQVFAFVINKKKEVKFQSRIGSCDLILGCVFCKTGRWGNWGRKR